MGHSQSSSFAVFSPVRAVDLEFANQWIEASCHSIYCYVPPWCRFALLHADKTFSRSVTNHRSASAVSLGLARMATAFRSAATVSGHKGLWVGLLRFAFGTRFGKLAHFITSSLTGQVVSDTRSCGFHSSEINAIGCRFGCQKKWD